MLIHLQTRIDVYKYILLLTTNRLFNGINYIPIPDIDKIDIDTLRIIGLQPCVIVMYISMFPLMDFAKNGCGDYSNFITA